MGIIPIKSNFNFSANKYKDWLSVPDNSSNSSNTTNSVVPVNVEELNAFNNDSNSKNSSSKIEDLYYEILMGINNISEDSGLYDIGEYRLTSYQDYAAFLETLKEKASKFPINKYDLYYAIASLRQKKYGIDNYYLYYSIIDQKYGEQLSFDEKLEMAIKIGSQDKKNNYSLAHSMPVICSGERTYEYERTSEEGYVKFEFKGGYLLFFNEYETTVTAPLSQFVVGEDGITQIEIDNGYTKKVSQYYSAVMDETLKYTNKYKDKTLDQLGTLDLLTIYGNYYQGVTTNTGVNEPASIEMNLCGDYNYCISAFNHEIGHVFSSRFVEGYGSREEWLEIYEIVNQYDSSHLLLSDYAYYDPEEFLAEIMAEYYNTNGTGDNNIYNPNDLKAIEINYNGYETLYDYIENLVGKKEISFG